MNPTNATNPPDDDDRRDLLISRATDGELDEKGWDELARLAERDRSIWRMVAAGQRDRADLARLAGGMAVIADAVAAPVEPVPSGAARTTPALPARAARAGARRGSRVWQEVRSLAGWGGGWAVAALIALAWLTGFRPLGSPPPPGAGAPQMAGVIPVRTAQDALDAYMEKGREEGRVLSPQPRRVLLETRPDPEGGDGYEVIFYQLLLERARVPSLYQFQGRDEGGRPALTRFRPAPRDDM